MKYDALWPYVTALLYYTGFPTCKAMSEALQNISHDRLNRMLHGSWSANFLLDWVIRLLFRVAGGWLTIDDTIIEKPHAKRTFETFWVYSHTHKKPVWGISVVLLVWSNGQLRIPLGFRVWKKAGPSKIDLALDLLSYARNRLKVKPEMVLFDSWYPAKRLLKRLDDYGWMYICQLKKNRNFNGVALSEKCQPYWSQVGYLSCTSRVFVVKHHKKYFACNRLSLAGRDVRRLYKRRQDVEEVIRCLKSSLDAEGCQVGYLRKKSVRKQEPQHGPQEHHIALCLVAYAVIEADRQGHDVSWRKYRQRFIFQRDSLKSPALSVLIDSA